MIILQTMRDNMLNLIYESHLGIEKSRARARATILARNVTWQKVESDILIVAGVCHGILYVDPR